MIKKLLIIAVLVASSITSICLSQDLIQWRGTDRNGIYTATGLLKEWPAEGPKLLWSFTGLGKGFSSVIVTGDKIFTTGQIDGTGFLFAFDKQGKLAWKVEYGKDWIDSYPGTRSTPTYFKGCIYLLTALGEALCLNAETGKKIWSIDLNAKFSAPDLRWGYVEAPVIDNNKVYFSPGSESVSMVALNRMTGETIWKTSSIGDKPSYCSPVMIDYKGKKIICTSLANNIIGVDPNDGKILWKVSQVNKTSIHPNTPIFKDGFIYSTTGYKTGGVMVKLSNDTKSVSELWRNTTLDSQIGGAVWVDNHIVGSGHQGDRSWQCLDSKTGNVIHVSTEIGKGAVIYADGLFYCYADNGELGILELNDKGFTLKSKFRVALGTDQHWAHPVIDNGILYIRHGDTLMAYSVKK